MGVIRKYYSVILGDFYKHYKKTDIGEYEHVDRKTYKRIIKGVFRWALKEMFQSKFHFTMPYALGDFYIKEINPSGWYKYYRCPHTYDKHFKFFYDKKYAIYDNLSFLEFQKNDATRYTLRIFYRMVANGSFKVPDPYSYPVKEFTDFGQVE